MGLEIWRHRGRLIHTVKALKKGELTIGFIGGSITDERPGHNWPETVVAWFTSHFPNVRVNVENAAIGATGSDFAVLRAQRDLIRRGCDLVFIEYAVNDNGIPSDQRERTREGLIRKLLKTGTMDLVVTYTFCQEMYEQMVQGEIPSSIRDFETLSEHYNLGSVWMGLYAFNEVQNGFMKWEEWLPDGLHPTYRGSYSYGQSVCQYLSKELFDFAETVQSIEGSVLLPPPHNLYHWGDVELLPFSNVQWSGPWSLRRSVRLAWADQILETHAIGARLSFEFYGNGLLLVFDFGKCSSEFRYRLDEGEWKTVHRDRPDWVEDSGWLRPVMIADVLLLGHHAIEIEVIHGNEPHAKGTTFRLTHIGILKYGN